MNKIVWGWACQHPRNLSYQLFTPELVLHAWFSWNINWYKWGWGATWICRCFLLSPPFYTPAHFSAPPALFLPHRLAAWIEKCFRAWQMLTKIRQETQVPCFDQSRPFSVPFLFRTPGKDFHRKARSTRLMYIFNASIFCSWEIEQFVPHITSNIQWCPKLSCLKALRREGMWAGQSLAQFVNLCQQTIIWVSVFFSVFVFSISTISLQNFTQFVCIYCPNLSTCVFKES